MAEIKQLDILLIDFDPVSNYITTEVFRRLGILNEIHICSNGNEGLRYIINQYQLTGKIPDLIILEMILPVMDGFEFLELIEESDLPLKNCQIVIVSNVFRESDIQYLQKLGQTNVFNKPLSTKKILPLLNSIFPSLELILKYQAD